MRLQHLQQLNHLLFSKQLHLDKRQSYSKIASRLSFIVFYFINRTFYSIDITRRKFLKLKRDIRFQRRDFHHIVDLILEIQLREDFKFEVI